MKKAFAAFVAVLLLCLLAGPGQARMLPSPIDESKVRPEITHEFVEELFQECTQNLNTYKVLSSYAFNKNEWQLITAYLNDNIKNPNIDNAGNIGRARELFFYIAQDVLSELKYDQVTNVTFIEEDSGDSIVDANIIVKFSNNHKEKIYVEFSRTLFDPRIDSISNISEGTSLILYIAKWENLDNLRCAGKVMLPENAGSEFIISPYGHDMYCPGLTEMQTNKLRQEIMQTSSPLIQ